ncbi:MAG TPA: glycosyltransferase family 4 protein [Pseudomonadales bacterium]|nr:glycosyltransferase family 4 protein [Pseudomonadales bacterium]
MEIHVFYTWGEQAAQAKYDPGFNQHIRWDIPLLDGYPYTWVHNKAKNPGSHHFWGIQCPELHAQVLAYRPDAVLVYGWNFYSHLRLMMRLKNRISVWFRGDSTLLDEPFMPRWKVIVRRSLLRWVYRHIDLALYAGQANKKYFEAHGLRANQLFFMPHAIDQARFAEWSPEKEQQLVNWRNELGIAPNDRVLLFVGKFEAKKNPLRLVNIFRKMTHPNLRLLLVGSGPQEAAIREAASRDNRVLVLPFQNQQVMPTVYRLGNGLILPSRGPGETWGLVVNEALASGIPVAASLRCGATYDLIPEALRFDPDNEEQIKAVITWLATENAPMVASEQRSLYTLGGQTHALVEASCCLPNK